MLEVINENDNVVGFETRAKIHQDGLLHREIYIWFFTPNGEIIFQHRAKDKDTYPDKLDATVLEQDMLDIFNQTRTIFKI